MLDPADSSGSTRWQVAAARHTPTHRPSSLGQHTRPWLKADPLSYSFLFAYSSYFNLKLFQPDSTTSTDKSHTSVLGARTLPPTPLQHTAFHPCLLIPIPEHYPMCLKCFSMYLRLFSRLCSCTTQKCKNTCIKTSVATWIQSIQFYSIPSRAPHSLSQKWTYYHFLSLPHSISIPLDFALPLPTEPSWASHHLTGYQRWHSTYMFQTPHCLACVSGCRADIESDRQSWIDMMEKKWWHEMQQ